MIRVCNLLITRRCNLNCFYCGIIKDGQKFKEKDNSYWIELVDVITKKYNKECFFIVYGGEPFLRPDLWELIKFMNENNVAYTIISNSLMREEIFKTLDKVGVFRGFTTSIDPILVDKTANKKSDRYMKTKKGYDLLVELIKLKATLDPVAEITATKQDISLLYDLVKLLSESGICSDITVIDPKKNEHYDFSTVSNPNMLVYRSDAEPVFKRIKEDPTLIVHLKDSLLDLLEYLPAEIDCELEKEITNICVNPDGTLRLCLRINGDATFDALDVLKNDRLDEVQEKLSDEKRRYCRGCAWTCILMSKCHECKEIIDHK